MTAVYLFFDRCLWPFSDRLCKGSPCEKPFQGYHPIPDEVPGFSLRSNPGLGLANAFGVKSS